MDCSIIIVEKEKEKKRKGEKEEKKLIGIYKIENKLNKKSYIGQSIHCGKRLDEHSKGSQLIDEVIQLEGIENFNFEILKEVEKEELSYWEDYYIIKFGTMFPNGYNKKWNCNKEIRKEISEKIEMEGKIGMGDLIIEDKNFSLQKERNIFKDLKYGVKFYAYLVCLSGLATYPKNTRMFRQKNLSLTEIKKATGITDAAAKQYLYQLEQTGMVEYTGEIKQLSEEENIVAWNKIQEKIKSRATKSEQAKARIEAQIYGAAIWKKRNKEEKNGVYYIKRPSPWTPIPEETLQFLNEYMQCSEVELKIYLWCVSYNDICNANAQAVKAVTFDDIRTELGFKNSSSAMNAEIRRTLILLQGLGLLDFQEYYTYNRKGVKIPSFLIKAIGYYVDYDIIENKPDDLADIDNTEIRKHIEEIYRGIKENSYQEN